MTLKGITEGSKLKFTKAKLQTITATQWYKSGLKGNCCAVGHLVNFEEDKAQTDISTSVKKVLEQYADVFQEPKGLPPSRPQDHSIPLLRDTNPINIRPYRYTFE